MMRTLLAPVVAALALSSSCGRGAPVTMLALDNVLVRQADGREDGLLRAGTTVVVRAGSFMDRGRNELWFLQDDRVVRKGPALVPMPPPTERRFAPLLGAVILRYNPDTKRHEGVRRLKARESVTVVPYATDHQLVVMRDDGTVEGVIDARAVEREPATAARMMARAVQLFSEHRFDDARWFAEQVVAIDPKQQDAARMAAAVQIARGELEGWRAWAKIKPPPLPRLPVQQRATAGARAFVVASELALRGRPSRRGELLALLPLGTDVQVEAIEGRWARVKVRDVALRSQTARDLGPLEKLASNTLHRVHTLVQKERSSIFVGAEHDAGAPRPPPPRTAHAGSADGGRAADRAPPREATAPDAGSAARDDELSQAQTGWVSTAYLDRVLPSVDDLRQRAFDASMKGNHALALTLLERRYAARPDEVSLEAALDEALEAKRWRRYLLLHARAEALKVGSAAFKISIERYAGCRGDPLSFEVLEIDEDLLPGDWEDVEALLEQGGDDDDDEATAEENDDEQDRVDHGGEPKPWSLPSLPAWPKNVCVARWVEELPCDHLGASPEVGGELEGLSEDERREVIEAWDRRVKAHEAGGEAAQRLLASRQQAVFDIVKAQTGAEQERFVLRLDNQGREAAAPGGYMVVYTGARFVTGYCGNIDEEGLQLHQAVVFKAPVVSGGSELDLWFDGGGHTVGVAFLDTEVAARRFIKELGVRRSPYAAENEEADEEEGAGRPLQVEVVDPIDDCEVGECGC